MHVTAAVIDLAPDRVQLATAAMGTRFEIVIDEPTTPALRAVGEAAVGEIERLHRLHSLFASDSLLSHVNRVAPTHPVPVDAATFEMLCDARAVWSASGGAFDITRGAGMEHVHLDALTRSVRFASAAVSIDLGGIAKGHAVDRAAEILRDNGVTRALIHGGTSSIAAIGAPREFAAGWRIAIAPTSHHVITLCDTTLSVSSASIRDHIINPHTGGFAQRVRIAAVIGPSATLGDAWSTAAAVLGYRPPSLSGEWKTIIE